MNELHVSTIKNKRIAACLLELYGTEVNLDSQNKGGGNYSYASLPHLQRIVMPVVKKHGLMLFQTVLNWDVEFRTVKVQKNAQSPPIDKQFCLAKCELETRLLDPETDGTVCNRVYGSKVDQSSGDKSLGAVTTAKRYGLAGIFNLILSDDDGGDTDASDNPFGLLETPAPKQATTASAADTKSMTMSQILGI